MRAVLGVLIMTLGGYVLGFLIGTLARLLN